MANTIEYFKQYVPLLDEIYKNASLSSVLDGNSDLVSAGRNANELVIPKMTMSGLADYSRSTGYVQGDVELTYETVKCNYDRGRMFVVDALDDMETAGIAFGRLAGEFIRTKVVPELDAYRFASYASASNIQTASGALTSGANVVTALRNAYNAMDEEEVPTEGRILFITPTLYGMVQDLDLTKSKQVLENVKVVKVPQTRFNSKVTLGTDGFTTSGSALNFLLIHPSATIQFQKHTVPKVVTPEANQEADAWKFGYRTVGIAEVYENKTKGIFAHTTA
jgi:hypothetical protein